MSLTALGAYTNLLCVAWDSTPIATLPNDSEQLRRLAGATGPEWDSISAEVLVNFESNPDNPNRLVNKRLYEQWSELNSHTKTMVERAKKGAAKRWQFLSEKEETVPNPDGADGIELVEGEV